MASPASTRSPGGTTSPPLARGPARVLYADDEEDVRDVFRHVFGGEFDVTCVDGGPAALEAMERASFDVLVSDMRMEPMRGTELLALALERHPDVARILLTGFSDHDDLAAAVNEGHVYAYVQKPWDASMLALTIRRAHEARAMGAENARLVEELRRANAGLEGDVEAVTRSAARPQLVVSSPAMGRVLAQVVAVAPTEASVLLQGETGVGKELVAVAIHERSARRRARFVAQNLAALPPELMASELFGHARGAFTGAQQARRGLFELAEGGTLFLDEVGEAPPALQAMLLRALESREVWPVGSHEPRRVDIRIVAATNKDLLAEANRGNFRLDLYYRLAVAPIAIPPLRERPEDVRGLGVPLLASAARRMNRPAPRLTDAAWRALERHDWPGNVRELANAMERLVIYRAGEEVDEGDLGVPVVPVALGPSAASAPPASASAAGPASAPAETAGAATVVLQLPATGTTFEDLEREILAQVLARAEGNQSRAARSLGLSESTFRSRLKRLGLKGT
jgi:two-component system response regulator HupR/HoxA